MDKQINKNQKQTKKPKKQNPKNPKHHYHGHRERLVKKINENPDALNDYEILESILFLIIPRKDTKPMAKDLLKKFGNLAEVLNAPAKELTDVDDVGVKTVQTLKLINAATNRQKLSKIIKTKKPVYDNWSDIYDYCINKTGYSKVEEFRILFINKKNILIADETHQKGTINFTPTYPREIVKRCLELGASGIILLHNHPSGDVTPSRNDIAITEKIIKTAEMMDIEVVDHIIVSKEGFASLRGMKLVSIWKDME